MRNNNIRNFVIISHIDHGKSTLADRFLELTGTVPKEKMRAQFLDQMDLERERGITIKMQPVRMIYHCHPEAGHRPTEGSRDLSVNPRDSSSSPPNASRARLQNDSYIFNLIDTPGHVDFSYEVSRALAAVEGAILLVDATKGIQAQTLNNLDLAKKQGLKIIGAVNKIDLANAQVDKTKNELADLLGQAPQEIFLISAKLGQGVPELLQAVIKQLPPPQTNGEKNLRALVFDFAYDSYKGVIAYVRIFNGQVKRGDHLQLLVANQKIEVLEAGVFRPQRVKQENLEPGEIGYIATGLKQAQLCRVGETLANVNTGIKPLAGYQEPRPMVFASFFPHQDNDYNLLTDALNKLKLNDASLTYQPDSSPLGRGYLCGFLGLLHLDIVRERLRREYDLDLTITTPSVAYQVVLTNGQHQIVTSIVNLPNWSKIKEIQEPWVELMVICPQKYLGPVMNLLSELRGQGLGLKAGLQGAMVSHQQTAIIEYQAPLSEIMTDFYDQLKSVSSGFASMSYQLTGWQPADLVLLDVLIAQEKFSSLSRLVPRQRASQEGRRIVKKLKKIVPRQNFAVALQAAIGGKVIVRETLPAMRKDVIGYLYGGDVTRKRKLLDKQKRGKKRLRQFGRVSLPPQVFFELLKRD